MKGKNAPRGCRFAAILVTLIALLLSHYCFSVPEAAGGEKLWTELEPAENPEGGFIIRSTTFIDLFKKLRPAVVNISTTKSAEKEGRSYHWFLDPKKKGDPELEPFKPYKKGPGKDYPVSSLGSGFIINGEGYIVTNHHVVKDTEKIFAKLYNGKEYEARVVGQDPKTDIALLKIDAESELPTVPLGDSDDLQVGEWVIAIGNPFGFEHSLTAGIVSAKDRFLGSSPYDDYIQTDASINPGNSGGPLFNTRGEVVGINTAILSSGQGLGFAAPINLAKELLPELMEKGEITRGWLGVRIEDVDEEMAKSAGLDHPAGVMVSKVIRDNPAEKAGMKDGDIILNFDGLDISDMRDLQKKVAKTPVGKKVKVKILRNGVEKTVEVELGVQTDEALTAAVEDVEKREVWGMIVRQLTPNLAEEMELSQNEGLYVAQVDPGGPAQRAGIQEGDIIKEINNEKVGSLDEFSRIVGDVKEDSSVLLLVLRGERTLYTAIKK